ncbi:LysM peptidoglycan-binding domain-containing protein [Candidatus Formimonas warabiya]|uniref:LysM domain-containing protein n=1 Tax=Formimonas warabiya TaxID=1761012 RepID=A0A3G1L0D0_FORW1|nr:LysM peptidoglycan-binding domain-containing protein [Candidatus Formimonas warabiya]ATW28101.1 hypothetical protein DCMF_28105 [Candidatus Formimonas warabiya]
MPIRRPTESISYIIQPGDTLGQIAQRFNISLDGIIEINPEIKDDNRLEVGRVIFIPGIRPPSSKPYTFGLTQYTIRPGDTLWEIAHRNRTNIETILSYNPGLDANSLQVGKIISLPRAAGPALSSPMGFMTYTIRPGDALWRLAELRNTTVKDILRYNPGLNPNYPQVGRMIFLP